MNNKQMIDTIVDMMAHYNMPHKYRVVLSWCIAKLMKEQANE